MSRFQPSTPTAVYLLILFSFQWSSVFPTETLTEQQSILYVKKLLAVTVSSISYLRAIFPEHAFGDRCLEGNGFRIVHIPSARAFFQTSFSNSQREKFCCEN